MDARTRYAPSRSIRHTGQLTYSGTKCRTNYTPHRIFPLTVADFRRATSALHEDSRKTHTACIICSKNMAPYALLPPAKIQSRYPWGKNYGDVHTADSSCITDRLAHEHVYKNYFSKKCAEMLEAIRPASSDGYTLPSCRKVPQLPHPKKLAGQS